MNGYRDRLAHFDISIKLTAGKSLVLTEYLSRNPIEEAVTQEIHEEKYAINILSEAFKLNHKHGQLKNTAQKCLSTDQSANLTLKTKRELSNEIASPKKLFPDVSSKDFTREQAQAINSISLNFNLSNKVYDFDFADSKMEKKVTYEYKNWRANKEVMDIIKEREKSPGTLQIIEKQQEITKPGNHRVKFDSILNRKVWVPRRPDKKGRDEVAAIDFELGFKNSEKNR